MSGYDQSSIAVPMPAVVGSAAALGGPYKIKPSEAFSSALMTISGLTGETISVETSPDGYWGAPASPTFYRTDWQGTQLLYSTARKNFCTRSQKLDNAAWTNLIGGTGVNPTVTADFGPGPEGGTTAERVQFDQGAGSTISDFTFRNTPTLSSVSVGQPVIVSFWAKSNTTPVTIVVAGGTLSATNATVYIGTTLQRYTALLGNATSASGVVRFGLRGTLSSVLTADITITDFQVEQNALAAATPFILTDAAAVTVTDYSISGGIITLGETPIAGATLSYDNGVLPSPYFVFATGDGVRNTFAYDGVWGTLTANSGKGNGIFQVDLRGAQAFKLTKSAGSETATVNMTLKRDALQYTNTAGTWTVT